MIGQLARRATIMGDLPVSFSDVEAHQDVQIYPSFAYRETSEAWRAMLSGITSYPRDRGIPQRVFLRLLKRLLRVDARVLESNPIFQSRIHGFMAEPQSAKQIVVRIGQGEPQPLRRSRRNGHFRGSPKFTQQQCEMTEATNGAQLAIAKVDVVLPPSDGRSIEGTMQLVERRGLTVISDIDDTIKISDVASRRELLQNTFLKPFRVVPGMTELYQSLAGRGAAFHYVSSSPWQLFRPLSDMLHHHGFPSGSFHLRSLRFRDPSVFGLFVSRKRAKFYTICQLMRLFPERSFVLIGDSGEKDAEVYGAVARKFPQQIEKVLIRRVDGLPWTRQRRDRVFRGLRRDQWQTFREPGQVEV